MRLQKQQLRKRQLHRAVAEIPVAQQALLRRHAAVVTLAVLRPRRQLRVGDVVAQQLHRAVAPEQLLHAVAVRSSPPTHATTSTS